MEIIRDLRAAFQPDALGTTPKEMQIRFFRYLNAKERESEFKALKALALAVRINQEIYAHLVSTGFIAQGKHELDLLLKERSYIVPDHNHPGHWHFHRFMEQALVSYMQSHTEEKKVARKIVSELLEYHASKARFAKMADCRAEHLDQYRMGVELAFHHLRNGFLPFQDLHRYFYACNKPFDTLFAAQLRLAEWGWAVASLPPLRTVLESFPSYGSSLSDRCA